MKIINFICTWTARLVGIPIIAAVWFLLTAFRGAATAFRDEWPRLKSDLIWLWEIYENSDK